MRHLSSTFQRLGLVTFLLAAACSGSEFAASGGKGTDKARDDASASRTDAGAERDDDQPDEPAAIAGAYLTCDWHSVPSKVDVGIQCGLLTEDGRLVRRGDRWQLEWSALDADGRPVSSARATSARGSATTIVTLHAKDVPTSAVRARIKGGDTDRTFEKRFKEVLPGLVDGDGGLEDCLVGTTALDQCFADAGIALGSANKLGQLAEGETIQDSVAGGGNEPSGKINAPTETGESDETVVPPPSPTPPKTEDTPPAKQRFFLTSRQWTGNLGGLDGADKLCQQAADAASLGGKWRAVIGTGNAGGNGRVTVRPPVHNIRNQPIANNATNFWNGVFSSSVPVLTERATVPQITTAWTSAVNGVALSACQSWTNGAGAQGSVGELNVVGAGLPSAAVWRAGNSPCGNLHGLYCIDGQ